MDENQLFLWALEQVGTGRDLAEAPPPKPASESSEKRKGHGRRALRRAKSVPILDDIKAYLEREQPHVLPKSSEAQAISYAISNWKALTRYCEDVDLEIDNNGAGS